MAMGHKIEHRKGDEGEFFIKGNDEDIFGFLDYTIEDDNQMIIQHTEVSEQLQGTGAARKLVDEAVDFAKSSGYKLTAECEYAAHVLKRHYPDLR